MKRLLTIFFLAPLFVMAQKVTTHKVTAKESLSSIARLYNVNPHKLAEFNKLDYDKGLSIGQVLKIPANATIPDAKETRPATPKNVKETVMKVPANGPGTPIYHMVAKKETLYHISTLYGKVPIADIKKWNHLTSDGVNEGTKLIVGYNKGETSAPDDRVEVVKEDIRVMPTKEEPVVIKEQPAPVKPIKETPPAKPAVVRADINYNGGYFKNGFSGSETTSGTADVFKSNSGWEDGKYYCLHNSAPVGSIVKITNTSGKSIYAKVLDIMPDIKQNEDLVILISNAAAKELGVGENKFDCTITYSK